MKDSKMNKKAAENKTDYLIARIHSNEGNQQKDLHRWIFENIDAAQNDITLELCCGTGKQSQYLSRLPNCKKLICVDVSEEAVNFIKKEDYYNPKQLSLVCNDID